MTKQPSSDASSLAARAMESSTSHDETHASPLINRPIVYQGITPPHSMTVEAAPFFTPSRNRRMAVRTVSTFTLILWLLAFAAFIVLYIGNIIAVDQLTMEVNTLQRRHQQILNEQEILKAELNRMSSLERINRKGMEELGLKSPTEPPIWLSVDEDKISNVQESLKQRRTQ
jgi:cell division protein FtsB